MVEAKLKKLQNRPREDHVTGFQCACRSAALAGAFLAGLGTAFGEGAPAAHPWLDPALLAAAKGEGSLIVYSSTNEQEGLPLFKIFEDATGIKVEYIRNADSPLMSRVA